MPQLVIVPSHIFIVFLRPSPAGLQSEAVFRLHSHLNRLILRFLELDLIDFHIIIPQLDRLFICNRSYFYSSKSAC